MDIKFILVVVGIFVVLIGFSVGFVLVRKRSSNFKMNVLAPIIREYFAESVFRPDVGLSTAEFDDIGCVKRGQYYTSEDLVSGVTKGGVPFKFAEVKTYDKHRTTGSDGHTHTHKVERYDGGVFVFAYPREFEGEIYITTRGVYRSHFFQHKWFGGWSKIETENIEFNKKFLVYSNSTFDVFYVLPPALLEKLIDLQKKYHRLFASIRQGTLYVMIPEVNLFRAPFLSINSRGAVEKAKKRTVKDLDYFSAIPAAFNMDDINKRSGLSVDERTQQMNAPRTYKSTADFVQQLGNHPVSLEDLKGLANHVSADMHGGANTGLDNGMSAMDNTPASNMLTNDVSLSNAPNMGATSMSNMPSDTPVDNITPDNNIGATQSIDGNPVQEVNESPFSFNFNKG